MKKVKNDGLNSLVFVGANETQALIHWKTKLRSARGRRRSTKARSGGSRVLRAFIGTFERIKLPLGFYSRWADNLYNNNVYMYIKYSTN